MRLIFCGTPEFAVPSLRALLEAGHGVELVVTQPDRAAGRGLEMQMPAVKQFALERGLPVVQPATIRSNAEFRAELERIRPDAIAVVAYGRILPEWMLALPRFGNINVHGSLLPKYRGAAPVQWAIARGERVSGVTTMLLDAGLDTGPMLQARDVPVPETAMAADLLDILAEVGGELLLETLRGLEDGTVQPVAQDGASSTLAPMLTREDGRIDFQLSAKQIRDRWRGFYPWPGAHTMLRGKKLIVHGMAVARAEELGEPIEGERAGELVVNGERLLTVCGGISVLEVTELQMEGKRRVTAAEFIRGHGIKAGERLG